MQNSTTEAQRRYRAARRAKGLCYLCASKVVQGLTLCEKHLIQDRVKSHERISKRANRGCCARCGKPLDIDADGGNKTCINCRLHVEYPRIRPITPKCRRNDAVISD